MRVKGGTVTRVLHFENAKPLKGSKGGRPIKTYHLNEQQINDDNRRHGNGNRRV